MRLDEYGDPVALDEPRRSDILDEQLAKDPGNRGGDAPVSGPLDKTPAAPSSGGGARDQALQSVQDTYKSALGRSATGSELSSEADNLNRYAFDAGPYGGVKAQIEKRATNLPNADGGGNATAQYSGGGGGYAQSGGSAADTQMSQFLQMLQSRDQQQQSQSASLRAILMQQLEGLQKPLDVNAPGVSQVLAAQRLAGQRGAERQRSALAERLSAEGLGDSGALDTGILGIEQGRSAQEQQNIGNVLGHELDARRQQLEQLLTLAVQSGDAESARNIAGQLEAIRAQMQESQFGRSLTQNQGQFNDSLGFNYNALNANQNSGSLAALLGMLG